MSKITEIAEEYRRQLNRNERYVLREMARHWARVVLRMNNEVDHLLRAVETAQQEGTPVHASWLHSLERYREMRAQAHRMTHAFAAESAELVRSAQRENIRLGTQQAREMLHVLAPDDHSWTRIDERGMEQMAGTLADGSPLEKLIREAAAESAAG